jgi:hypothetical protein
MNALIIWYLKHQSVHLNMIWLHEFASAFLRNTIYINALIFKTPVRVHLNSIWLHEFASFLRNTLYINALIFKTPVRAVKYDMTSWVCCVFKKYALGQWKLISCFSSTIFKHLERDFFIFHYFLYLNSACQ